MGARGKAFAMFGVAAGAGLLYALLRGVGLKHMAERVSVQVVPNLAQVRATWQRLVVPVDVRVSNRSIEAVDVRVNSVKLLDGDREIADVAASTGATVHTVRPYSDTTVPVDIEVPAFGTLTLTTAAGLTDVIQRAIAAGRDGGFKEGFVEFLGEGKARVAAWVQRLTAVVSIEAEGIPLSIPIRLGGAKGGDGGATARGLGLAARSDRAIRPLSDYAHLIPSRRMLLRKDPVVLYGTTAETAVLIREMARQNRWHTKALAERLAGESLDATLRNIYNFVYDHVAYVRDAPTREQVRTPLRTLYDQQGDCDCYATLIASMLENLGVAYRVRLAAYHGRDYFQHVYIVVPTRGNARGYYVVDPVVEGYNNEEPYTMIKDF